MGILAAVSLGRERDIVLVLLRKNCDGFKDCSGNHRGRRAGLVCRKLLIKLTQQLKHKLSECDGGVQVALARGDGRARVLRDALNVIVSTV